MRKGKMIANENVSIILNLLTVVKVVAKKRIIISKQLNELQNILDSFKEDENFCSKSGNESNSQDKAIAKLPVITKLPKLKAITIGRDLHWKRGRRR